MSGYEEEKRTSGDEKEKKETSGDEEEKKRRLGTRRRKKDIWGPGGKKRMTGDELVIQKNCHMKKAISNFAAVGCLLKR